MQSVKWWQRNCKSYHLITSIIVNFYNNTTLNSIIYEVRVLNTPGAIFYSSA